MKFCLQRASFIHVLILSIAASGCASSAMMNSGIAANANSASTTSAERTADSSEKKSNSSATIPIESGGPADTVRVFYTKLREKKFREAIFMTNLRPAVESLTDAELAEFSLDFEALAGQVPAEIEINGEIITGDKATVTVNLPDEDGVKQSQPIKLKRENNVWIILTVDESAEASIKAEGKNFLYKLRIDTFQEEARAMLERISKSQIVHSLQNNGKFADIKTLVASGLLPEDVETSRSTGYNYIVTLAGDGKSYFATATPAEYGKTGKLSFLMELQPKGPPKITSRDNGGKPLKK